MLRTDLQRGRGDYSGCDWAGGDTNDCEKVYKGKMRQGAGVNGVF